MSARDAKPREFQVDWQADHGKPSSAAAIAGKVAA
jgi:hypothetical protein